MEKAMQKYLDKQIDRAEFAKEVQDYWTNLSEISKRQIHNWLLVKKLPGRVMNTDPATATKRGKERQRDE